MIKQYYRRDIALWNIYLRKASGLKRNILHWHKKFNGKDKKTLRKILPHHFITV